jgi:hypothetical protein
MYPSGAPVKFCQTRRTHKWTSVIPSRRDGELSHMRYEAELRCVCVRHDDAIHPTHTPMGTHMDAFGECVAPVKSRRMSMKFLSATT